MYDLRTTMAIAAVACIRAFAKMASDSPLYRSTDSIINEGMPAFYVCYPLVLKLCLYFSLQFHNKQDGLNKPTTGPVVRIPDSQVRLQTLTETQSDVTETLKCGSGNSALISFRCNCILKYKQYQEFSQAV